jgi:ABC-type Zn uptake system ZnuABC Zn-binding protein ZnuA
MRKTIAGLSLLLLGAAPAAAAVQVVTTLQDFASIASSVGGSRVETFALAKGHQDPHFVDPKPSFVLKLNKADLYVATGLDLEIGYIGPLLDQSRNAKIRPGARGYLDASVGCDILDRPTGTVTRAMGDVHPFGNPHYWVDPENGRIIARAIAARLSEIDPAGRASYEKNLAAFEARLTEKAKEWQAKMAPYAGARVVSFHNSWPNFAKRFGIRIVGFVEPKPGIPPTPAHTLEIINLIETEKIPLILIEPYFHSKTPDFIASKTGVTVLRFHPSVGGAPGITDYISLFDVNIDAFVNAMKGVR